MGISVKREKKQTIKRKNIIASFSNLLAHNIFYILENERLLIWKSKEISVGVGIMLNRAGENAAAALFLEQPARVVSATGSFVADS